MKPKLKNIISWFAVGVMILSNVFSPIATAYTATDAHTFFVMPDHDVTLRATSSANTYTIAFNANGWTGTMDNMAMTYGQTWTIPGNSYTKTWYTFVKWNTNAAGTWTSYTSGQVVSNLATWWTVNLYAIWNANKYKVSFNANEWEDTINPVVWTMPTQTYTYDQTWSLPANQFVRTWYEFQWWSTTSGWSGSYQDQASVHNWRYTSGLTVQLYAVWTATEVTYTVEHYLMDTGGNYPTTPSYTNTYTGTTYDIVTWAKRNDAWMTLSWELQSEHLKWDGSTLFTYYYERGKNTLTVNAGTWVANVSWGWSKYYGESVTVSATLKTWYENLRWTWDKTTATFNMPNSDVNMTAYATPINYVITVDVWSGTMPEGTGIITYNVEDVASGFVLSDPTRIWYDFVWWSWTTVSWTTTTWYQLPAWTIGNFELEAVWTPKSDVEYKVYHMHENLSGEYEEISVDTYTWWTADATLILANLKKDIDGDCVTYTWWSLTLSTWWLVNPRLTTTVLPDGSRKIYLYYTRNTYTVTLDKDNWIASVSPETKTYKCWETVEINATPKSWYTFNVWEVTDPTSWWTPVTP